MLMDAEGNVQILPHATGQAIGIFDDLLLEENSVTLLPGGTLVLFIDGLTDCRNPLGQVFGHVRVQNLLSGLAGWNGQQVCDALRDALTTSQSGALQDDDVTLVAVHSVK
jgi:sigma-B regulation protein RsbU (phosphoserine phosphatase)